MCAQSMRPTHNSEPQAQFLTTNKLFSVAYFHEKDKQTLKCISQQRNTSQFYIPAFFTVILAKPFSLWCNIHSTSYFPIPYFITWLPSKPSHQRNTFILVTYLYNIPFRLPNLKLQVLITSLRDFIIILPWMLLPIHSIRWIGSINDKWDQYKSWYKINFGELKKVTSKLNLHNKKSFIWNTFPYGLSITN
jgi:hypothetical protein